MGHWVSKEYFLTAPLSSETPLSPHFVAPNGYKGERPGSASVEQPMLLYIDIAARPLVKRL